MQIRFGTDGWRAVIAREFTFDNLKTVTLAAAEYFLHHTDTSNGICVGYDTRFMSREFARFTADTLSSRGLNVLLSSTFTPTPAVSLYTRNKRLAGGIMITASHNPPTYNGFKVKDAYGGSAKPESIALIERYIDSIDVDEQLQPQKHLVEEVDLKQFYIDHLMSVIDIDLIRDSQLTIAHNAMFGAGQEILTGIFDESVISAYHCSRNPGFLDINPEPVPQNIGDFIDFFNEVQTDVGIINDGDADRIGMLDEHGSFVDSHKIFAILLKHLVEDRTMTGEVAKTFALTDLIDRICEKHGLRLHTLPVGFKYVSQLMTERNILIGGEESGGIGITSYLPERDGLYIGLLVMEIMARKKTTLSGLVQELFAEYGCRYYERHDLALSESRKQAIVSRASQGDFTRIANHRVTGFNDLDGYKYHFEGGWLLIRPSGTEPVLRLYCEADSPDTVSKALSFAETIA
ncbi:MAG: phosphoglucomutase/phosphomannomutase family protein [Prosthecochloris sp.]|nr:phosphoglucomutase/phosphomannomutase family protein [Prosthecochloris sp.]